MLPLRLLSTSRLSRPLLAGKRANWPLGSTCSRLISSTASVTPVDLAYDEVIPENGNKHDHPLVIIHGFFGSKRNWGSLSKAFMKDLNRPVYALDLRNSGSSPHAKPMTYTAMSADVLHFCRTHSLRNISLLGHSMGGKVAMAFALNPDLPAELLANLIVADISPAKGDISAEFRGYLEGMKKIEASHVRSRKEAQEILSHYEKDPGVRAFLLTNLDTTHYEHAAMKFKVPLDILDEAIPEIGSFPYEVGQRTWDGKTLFIKGSKSKYINRHNLPQAKAFFPNMALETLEASHWVHAEKPNEFKQLVTEFIGTNL
ncbi:hypothetical protein PLICRDRAFT_137904 [Plicaturopsis crispa FD-325 SS-3]|nr:hypothetical protein PLICRDRAFT_137904 [Plicaturopsis crispa FD-325 SS-3]